MFQKCGIQSLVEHNYFAVEQLNQQTNNARNNEVGLEAGLGTSRAVP